MNVYYVYAYLDPRKPAQYDLLEKNVDFEPFYIGKGKGKRIRSHLTMKTAHHKNHIIKKLFSLGLQPIIVMIKDNMSESEALLLETEIIINVGTLSPILGVKIGPLTNLKIEGHCSGISDETKIKISEFHKNRKRSPHSEKTKQKMRSAILMRTEDQKKEISKKLSAAGKGKKKPEQSERMSKLHKGKIISDEHKKKISEFFTGRKKSKTERALLSDIQKKEWKIITENNEIFSVTDLQKWCDDKNISYSTLYGTRKRNKFHKGYKIISSSGGTH